MRTQYLVTRSMTWDDGDDDGDQQVGVREQPALFFLVVKVGIKICVCV